MGGLRTKIPWTFWTFADRHRWPSPGSRSSPASTARTRSCCSARAPSAGCSSAIGLFTALLTAFYMSRLLFLTFFGEFRGGHEAEHHVHESPWTMLVPLVLLAVGSLRGRAASTCPAVRASRSFRLPDEARPARRPGCPYVATVDRARRASLGAFYLYVMFTDAARRRSPPPSRPALPRPRGEVLLRRRLRRVRAPAWWWTAATRVLWKRRRRRAHRRRR